MRIDMTNKNDNIDFILGAGFILAAVLYALCDINPICTLVLVVIVSAIYENVFDRSVI
ncbi:MULTISPECIES: hypothetical protein [Campylobacter]|uniref:hypothetical protein n=1 Tax=Campylobacter TaxID=194 RepID=UPI0019D010CA|nr:MULTISPECIES: hypothetical protein [Campylobacter]MBN7287464.1 hypothetical protein [Campylobacter curvus]MDU6828082.1 hypothetical protein [Campylobacter sp.]